MSVEIKSITRFSRLYPKRPVIDVHCHAFKDPSGLRALAAKHSLPLYGKGTVREAAETMADLGIRWRILKNLAAKPKSVRRANDFAIAVARKHARLLPTGTIHLGYPENEAEVERLAEAGIKGIAFNSTWQGFDVSARQLRSVYRKISGYQMFIIAHCGIDPISRHPEQQTWPEQMLRLKEMAPDSPVIATHLGAFGDFGRAKEYKGSEILLDLAFIREAINGQIVGAPPTAEEITNLLTFLGEDMLVCGFDYPWADPGANIVMWQHFFSNGSFFPAQAWEKVSHENVARALGLKIISQK